MELLAALIGAVIGFAGAVLGAWLTTRHTQRERERLANQAVLRLTLKADALIDRESELEGKYQDPGYFQAEEAVDQLALELEIVAATTAKKDRDSLRTLALALLDRSQVGPSPRRVAQRALSATRRIASARLYDEEPGAWVSEAVKDFKEQLALVEEMQLENFRDQQRYEQEQRAARKRKDASADGKDSSGS
jgi:hypothetical protein